MKKHRWWDYFRYFLSQGPPEPEPIPKLSVVTIQKGDVLVVNVDRQLSPESRQQLHDSMHRAFGRDCKVAVLGRGVELSVVRRAI